MNFRNDQRELQGHRPTPLRINKNSHKIKKPPLGPHQQPRQPVIIYTVSPKTIHTTPNEFMNLVQCLTGYKNKVSSVDPLNDDNNSCKTTSTIVEARALFEDINRHHQSGDVEQIDVFSNRHHQSGDVEQIDVFSPSSDPAMVRFLQELSPVLHHGNRSFVEGNFIMQSPSNFLSPPASSIDLFNNFSN